MTALVIQAATISVVVLALGRRDRKRRRDSAEAFRRLFDD